MYVSMYPHFILTPDDAHHNDQRLTATGQKLLIVQQQQAPSSSSRQTYARKVAHPECTLWLVACFGAYGAAPQPPPGKTPAVLLCSAVVLSSSAIINQLRGQQYARACCRNRVPAPPLPRTAVSAVARAVRLEFLDRQARHNFTDIYSRPKYCGTAAGHPPQPLRSTAVVVAVYFLRSSFAFIPHTPPISCCAEDTPPALRRIKIDRNA